MDPTTTAGNGLDVNSVNNAVPKTDRKAYRREWMRNWREQQRDKAQPEKQAAENNGINNPITPEPELKVASPQLNAEPQPRLKSETPVADKSESEKYQQAITQSDTAAERLRQQLRAVNAAQQFNHQQQQQAAYAEQVAQLFRWWQQNGLKPDDERFLLGHPAAIGELTHFAGQEASKQGLQPNTAEYTERAKEIFHTHLRHLREQVAANAPMPEMPAQGNPMHETMPPAPPLLGPMPAPRCPSRSDRSIAHRCHARRQEPELMKLRVIRDPCI
jgi:hypothetical protein